MSETLKLILSLSVSGGLLALALFALKPFMRSRLSKSFQYYIWLVVLLRFILPFSFGINLMDFMLNVPNEPQMAEETVIPNNPISQANINPTVNNAVNSNEPNITGQQMPRPTTQESAKPFNAAKALADNLLWIWLAGAVISAAWNMLGYMRFIRYVHGAAYAVDMPDCGAKVYKSRFAPTPMLVGVIRPRIYLPDIEYTDGQLDNILLHELTHLRRRDVWLKWFAALVVSVHWFNPIAYFMRREFNRACELSCDEAVIRKLDGEAKQSYGDTLISVVAESRYPVGVMSVTMCEEKTKLKERLIAIMNYKKKTKIAVLITAVLAVVITGSAFAFGASVGASNRNLIEMEAIYSDVTEYSHSLQVKWGERTYSPSTDYSDGFKVGKQIGVIHDEHGNKYKIYECEGLSTDRYLVVRYDVIMSTYDLFAADANYLTLAEVEKMNGQPQSTVRTYLGEANGVLSGFWGEIYELADGRQAILYYGSDSRVENIVVNASETQYDISLADLRQLAAKGDELIFEDFIDYNGQEVGSGLYILYFKIEGGYTLLVAAGGVNGKPMYAYLEIPGIEESIDIRYSDIDEFISKYPVPNELSGQIYGYLDTIMSSPSLSSATGDYIKAHQTEYDAILDMGVAALPTLTGILNIGDMGLRGNIVVILVQDIIAAESDKPQSDWTDGVLQSAASDIERWSRGFPLNETPETRDEQPYESSGNSLKTIDEAMTWFLQKKESQAYLVGDYYAVSYRILDTKDTTTQTIVYAFILSEWVSLNGEVVSGGSGLSSVTFKRVDDLYEFETNTHYDGQQIPGSSEIPQKVKDILTNDSFDEIYNEMQTEIDNDIRDFLNKH